MLHHILARDRGYLETTMVFNDLDICIHAVQFGLTDHFRADTCLWLRGEQLTCVLLFSTCADLLFARQECVYTQSKPQVRQLTFCSCKVTMYVIDALNLIQFLCFACERRFLHALKFTSLTRSEARLLCAASICSPGRKEARFRGCLPAQPRTVSDKCGE